MDINVDAIIINDPIWRTSTLSTRHPGGQIPTPPSDEDMVGVTKLMVLAMCSDGVSPAVQAAIRALQGEVVGWRNAQRERAIRGAGVGGITAAELNLALQT